MSKRKKHDELPTRQVRKSITTVLHKIEECIRINKTPGGSSVPAITKALLSEFNYNNATAVKKALKDGVDKGLLTKNKASYLVTGDPMYVDTSEKVDIEDIKIGKGDTIVLGDAVTIGYVGKIAATGVQFEAAKQFSFVVGAKEVIKGMDQGVLGMKRGGSKRVVTIPSGLAYGKRGSSPDIAPNTDLVFEISVS